MQCSSTSRPASAGKERLANASCQRPASAGSQRSIPRTGCASHSSSAACRESQKLAIVDTDETLPWEVLGPVPESLATPMEKQLAKAIGLEGHHVVVRLPYDAEMCPSGPRCYWRWLGRAILERVSSERLCNMTLPDAISKVRRELAGLRANNQRDARTIAELLEFRAEAEKKLREFDEVHMKLDLALEDKEEVLNANGRLIASVRELQDEVKHLVAEQRRIVEGELSDAQRRACKAEGALHDMTRSHSATEKRLLESQRELSEAKAEAARLRQALEVQNRRARAATKKQERWGDTEWRRGQQVYRKAALDTGVKEAGETEEWWRGKPTSPR